MDRQYSSGVSDYSPSTSSQGRQNSTHAGESNRAVPNFNLGDGPGTKRDNEQDDGSGVSDYSPRPYDPATRGQFDSGEEGLYSPTSPRYSPAASRHAVSDYSGGEENYDSTSDRALRKARRSEQRQGALEIDTTAGYGDAQPASEKTRKFWASHKACSSQPDQAVGAQSEGDHKKFDLWLRGRDSATKKQKRKRASVEFVQFLITQNQNLSERLERVEIALALMQIQTEPHEKPKTSVTKDKSTQDQHGSIAKDDPETQKAESAVQRERLRLAKDVCVVACLVVGIIVLLKLPRLLDAVMGLVDQKTKTLRMEASANCNAGQ
jgi:hypothetical protein